MTKIIPRAGNEFPFFMILFDSGDGMFFDVSENHLNIIEEDFFDNLQDNEGKFRSCLTLLLSSYQCRGWTEQPRHSQL